MHLAWNPFSLLVSLWTMIAGSSNPAAVPAAVGLAPAAVVQEATLENGFAPGRSTFVAQLGDMKSGYRVLAMTVLPGETLPLEVTQGPDGATFSARATASEAIANGPNRWSWTAPRETGLYPIEISEPGVAPMTLNVFVVEPYRPGLTTIHGYAIGRYPSVASANYTPPKGFIEVTPQNANTLVSPHFRLEQFLCKQGGEGFPKYVVLREPLFVKLESVLEEVNRRGIDADGFTVMSGYRTPEYNHGLGNVKLSRHTWGDASDIYVDEAPRDGRMDDLNRDGRVNERDAEYLKSIVESVTEAAPYDPIVGGIGTYGATHTHGPFVHVDARGFRARWEG